MLAKLTRGFCFSFHDNMRLSAKCFGSRETFSESQETLRVSEISAGIVHIRNLKAADRIFSSVVFRERDLGLPET